MKRRSGQVMQSREMVYKKTLSSNLMALSVVECEAMGASCPVPYLVIRKISDHADSHNNDDWHGYASAVAAAYVRYCSSIC
jgi:nucleoside phosphorylase